MKRRENAGRPTIIKMMEASTSNITFEDTEALDEGRSSETGPANPVISFPKDDYGYFIWTLDVESLKTDAKILREYGYSEAFINLMTLAANQGSEWLMLDRDADPVPGLPVFYW